jgi:phosphoribosylanthranilate isomerase
MVNVKICGIRTPTDLAAASAAGADAIGLNFYAGSKRHISLEAAREIAEAAGSSMLRVGLFVNAEASFIPKMYQAVPLDFIQAHGNEDTAWFAGVKQYPIPIIRAIRCAQSKEELLAEIEKVPQSPDFYDILLIDGTSPGSPIPGAPQVYGGSGALANWSLIRQVRDSIRMPLMLAGGLTPENVAEAVKTVAPDWVDVAGGVEGVSGGKDADKVARFVAAAKGGRVSPSQS